MNSRCSRGTSSQRTPPAALERSDSFPDLDEDLGSAVPDLDADLDSLLLPTLVDFIVNSTVGLGLADLGAVPDLDEDLGAIHRT